MWKCENSKTEISLDVNARNYRSYVMGEVSCKPTC